MSQRPYVGGHPEIPLHPYEPTGEGTCAACIRAAMSDVTEAPASIPPQHQGKEPSRE